MPKDERQPDWLDVEEELLGTDDVPRVPVELEEEDWGTHDGAVDTTDVDVEVPDAYEAQRPPWVIVGEYEEEDLGTIRSGKEAEVRLVRRTHGERSCLLAVKRYRPRSERAFRRENAYMGNPDYPDDRVNKAIRKRTRFGKGVLEYAWAANEFPHMRSAWLTGTRVPYPVDMLHDGLAMQYIGDLEGAAPRLLEVTLADPQAVFEDLVEQIRRMLDAYLVHADLSAYNILWWDEKAWIIDMPQASDIAKHDAAVDFLRRDIANLTKFFRRLGVYADPEIVMNDIARTAPFDWGVLTPR